MAKQHMNNKKFMLISIPITAIVLGTSIAATCVMNMHPMVMDSVLGSGKKHVTNPEFSESWDLNYYTMDAKNSDEAFQSASDTSKRISDEGIILLKNGSKNGTPMLPLAKQTNVTPFGYRYLNPVVSVLGSGSVHDGMFNYTITNSRSSTMESALASNFKVNSSVVDAMKAASVVKTDAAEGTTPCQELPYINACAGSNTYLYEYDPSIYSSYGSSCSNTAGIVYIGRDAGEGGDLKWDGYADGTPHELALSVAEKQTIAFAKANCGKGVVAVINASNVMELSELMSGDYAVDAIVWIGFTGQSGCQSLSDILCGNVNPSGRTVDTWPSDLLADPVMQNYGTFLYSNFESETSYVEYEEGVYVGYKYYETAAEMDSSFDYSKEVIYPFGYGLSYSNFKEEITDYSDSGANIAMTIKVTNEGEVAGKDVLEVYYKAPYTSLDITNKIEKPTVNLIDFAKTSLLEPGAEEEIQITFAKEDMASYCYTHDNDDGTTGCYMLEGGDYEVSLRKNSHEAIATKTTNVSSTSWYTPDNPRQSEKDGQSALDNDGNPLGVPAKIQEDSSAKFVAAANQFEDSNTYMSKSSVTLLSRSDWKGTQPTRPESNVAAEQFVLDDVNHYSPDNFDVNNDPNFGNVPGSLVYQKDAPTSKADNGLTVADMRGLDYYDKNWDSLLDQLDYSSDELKQLFYGGAYATSSLSSIKLPSTASAEGPEGFGLFERLMAGYLLHASNLPTTAAYPNAVVLSSSWNKDLAYQYGSSVGQEAYYYHLSTDSFLNGWTGPAMNSHRSPFNGRNCEYYSEDPLLSGYIGAHTVSGAGDRGLYTVFKHFALNDMETAKTKNYGICTWATEQTMREEYFKTFEIVFKQSRRSVTYISDTNGTKTTKQMRGATGVMTSFNRVGSMAAGNNYALINNVLRNEWGFEGFVQTDMPSQTNKDLLLRTGADMEMNMAVTPASDMSSPTMQHCMRRAVHNIAYTVANCSVMQGTAPGAIITYDISPWKIWLTTIDVIAGVGTACVAGWIIYRLVDEKKHPEKYRRKEKKA
jgi:beta-glucosidase